MRYENKGVVVTGGSKGIGFGCVKTFVEDGGRGGCGGQIFVPCGVCGGGGGKCGSGP
jgi:hypothetical protein